MIDIISWEIIIITTHRISFATLLISVILRLVLPKLLDNPDDESFNAHVYKILVRVCQLMAIFLLISGGFRAFLFPIPPFFVIKLPFAGLTIAAQFYPHKYGTEKAYKVTFITLLLVIMTASIGVLLEAPFL